MTDPEGRQVYLGPALAEDVLYPKEECLVAHCRKESARGRKVLVYLRQTGTRDIQPRLSAILENAGLRVRVLRQNVDPSRREEWVRRESPRCDVLVCNPKLVETGLALLAFPSMVFFETEYSLYTLMQAARRSWRLGQTEPVEVYWLAYEGTMEHRAIALVGRKIGAASLVYGDEAAAALAEQAGAGRGLLHELAQEVIKGAEIQDLTDLFVQANQADGWLAAAGMDGSLTMWTEETAAVVVPAVPPEPAITITVAPPPGKAAQLAFFGLLEGAEESFTWVEAGRPFPGLFPVFRGTSSRSAMPAMASRTYRPASWPTDNLDHTTSGPPQRLLVLSRGHQPKTMAYLIELGRGQPVAGLHWSYRCSDIDLDIAAQTTFVRL